MIDGRTLKEELQKYPLGTLFRCVGHWHKTGHYKVNGIYRVELNPDFRLYKDLALVSPIDPHKRYARGNGFSGQWELVDIDKSLEDYL